MRKVLLISSAYSWGSAAGSTRMSKMLKWLPQCGWDPTLLTVSTLPLHPETVRLPGEPESIHRLQVLPPGLKRLMGLRKENVRRLEATGRQRSRWFNLLARLHYNVFEFPDPARNWIAPGVQLGMELARAGGFDVLYSSSPEVSGHFVAFRLQRRLGLPWIHEYRDLWAGNPWRSATSEAYGWRDWLERYWERRFWERSRKAVVMTPSNAQILAARIPPQAKAQIEVVPNGFDSAEVPTDVATPRGLPFRLCYTGSLYGGKRDLSGLFGAIRNLADSSDLRAGELEFTFAGPDGTAVRTMAERCGIATFVREVGIVNAAEAKRLQQSSHLLVLVENATDTPWIRGNMPGKAYEYLGAGRPVLALAHPGSSIAALFNETGTGVTFRPTDTPALTNFLRASMLEVRASGVLGYEPDTAAIRANSWESISKRLAAVLDGTLYSV